MTIISISSARTVCCRSSHSDTKNNNKTATTATVVDTVDTDVVHVVDCVKTFDEILKCVRHHAVTLGHFHVKQ